MPFDKKQNFESSAAPEEQCDQLPDEIEKIIKKVIEDHKSIAQRHTLIEAKNKLEREIHKKIGEEMADQYAEAIEKKLNTILHID